MIKAVILPFVIFLLALVLYVPLTSATEVSVREAIYANVATSIEVNAPTELYWGDLSIGPNVSEPQDVNIKSNLSYSVQMHSVTRTRMAEYDIAADEFVSDGKSLTEALYWKFEDSVEDPIKISRTDELIISNNPPTGDSGEDISICFVQEIDYGDERLPEGKAYRIDVVYTAVQDV